MHAQYKKDLSVNPCDVVNIKEIARMKIKKSTRYEQIVLIENIELQYASK